MGLRNVGRVLQPDLTLVGQKALISHVVVVEQAGFLSDSRAGGAGNTVRLSGILFAVSQWREAHQAQGRWVDGFVGPLHSPYVSHPNSELSHGPSYSHGTKGGEISLGARNVTHPGRILNRFPIWANLWWAVLPSSG